VIRRAGPEDAAAIAAVFRSARRGCLPRLPELHAPAEELRFFRDHVLQQCDVWVALAPHVVGFCAFAGGWLEHLYVDPAWHDRGFGTVLLNLAQRQQRTLQLWVFQRNERAIRFYRNHGFQVVEATDGRRNEEQEPDLRMRWDAEGYAEW
jgi:ribosomal protein S18 acetylase RimI-like enzyme